MVKENLNFTNGFTFLYLPKNTHISIDKSNIIMFESREYFWLHRCYESWTERKFDNYNMALTMIDILFEKHLINEATYNNIVKKNKYKIPYSA